VHKAARITHCVSSGALARPRRFDSGLVWMVSCLDTGEQNLVNRNMNGSTKGQDHVLNESFLKVEYILQKRFVSFVLPFAAPPLRQTLKTKILGMNRSLTYSLHLITMAVEVDKSLIVRWMPIQAHQSDPSTNVFAIVHTYLLSNSYTADQNLRVCGVNICSS
jgi:hypothetical protein